MQKVKVGHSWEIPEGGSEQGRIGGYALVLKDGLLYIQGKRSFDYSNSPIERASMYPFTKDTFEEVEGGLSDVFDLKDNFVYYVVEYGLSTAYVFKDQETALHMVSFLVETKVQSLKESFQG